MHLGIDGDTLIFFSSDNGGADDSAEYNDQSRMTQHNGGLRARKGFFWEGGTRVPFIVRWPGQVPKGLIYHQPVSHLDIFATAVAAAEAPLPAKPLDGVNLIPYLNGEIKVPPHKTLYWGFEEAHKRWAIRHGDWKLTMEIKNNQAILDKNFDSVLELHNLADDPLEQNNLLYKHPDKAKELMALRDAFYKPLPPSICTPEMIKAWEKDFAFREERLRQNHNIEDKNTLRRDGYPGRWR
jgi:arylsulfatase A-like enzyme